LRGVALAAAGGTAATLVGCGGNSNDSSKATKPQATTVAAGMPPTSTQAGAANPAGAVGTAAAAQVTKAPASQPKSGGSLRMRTYLQGPLNFDPFPLISGRVQLYTGMVYESLLTFKYGPEVKVGSYLVDPMLATSWETPDPMTYVFHLRQGVKFHNKPPVNARQFVAQDVLYSFQRRMVKESPYFTSMYSLIKDLQAPDAQTVRVTLSEPFAPFLIYIGTYLATIVAPEGEKQFSDYTKPESAIGTGRWMLDSFEPNVKTLFKKNLEHYVKPLPYLDEDQELVVTDDAAALAAFRSEQLDYEGVGLTKSDADSLKKSNPKSTILPSSWVGRAATSFGIFFTMRTDKQPFNDVRVRQAIALSIDRDGMINGLHEGASIQAAPVPPAYGDYSLPVDQLGGGAKYYKRDVAAAKQLLTAAGFANGLDTEIAKLTGGPTWYDDDFSFLQKNLADAGIRAKVAGLDYAAFAQTAQRGQQDQMGYLTAANQPDVDSVLFRYYYPGQSTNNSHVDDQQLSDMLVAQRREADHEKRKQIVWDIQKYLAEQQYMIFAPWRDAYEVLQPWVKGIGPSAFGDLLSAFGNGIAMSNWWIDKG
jgi:peptide/nickel transport system substrate-binding protein